MDAIKYSIGSNCALLVHASRKEQCMNVSYIVVIHLMVSFHKTQTAFDSTTDFICQLTADVKERIIDCLQLINLKPKRSCARTLKTGKHSHKPLHTT